MKFLFIALLVVASSYVSSSINISQVFGSEWNLAIPIEPDSKPVLGEVSKFGNILFNDTISDYSCVSFLRCGGTGISTCQGAGGPVLVFSCSSSDSNIKIKGSEFGCAYSDNQQECFMLLKLTNSSNKNDDERLNMRW